MKEFQILDKYLSSSVAGLPKNVKYINRHLNNKNSNFISPSWIPDIY